ncbi:beta-1,4-N-acetylgalactosaminyltransferase bre-4 [Magallana gigas]|uniref:beta-1,4-N-acetylgalactosaminyltransferase bre-4 n=1 Tax=Magallana gigas TaxID=29159 RepID=UPI003341D97A
MSLTVVKKAAVLIIFLQTVHLVLWYSSVKGKPRAMYEQNGNISVNICPLIPQGLVGKINVEKSNTDWLKIESKYTMVSNGSHHPENCSARHKVAILVPFRDRESHLRIFLNHMHAFLMKQQLEYAIYVVELDKDIPFNRGFLFNVGFMEATKDKEFGCFVFHDVDLLPLNDQNLYQCPDQPRHMSVAIDKYKFKLLYDENFGGVSSMSKDHFKTINGYSNLFFGWGGEDDDLFNRIVSNKMIITRILSNIASYTMLPHIHASENPLRYEVLTTGKNESTQNKDGLSNLKYHVTEKIYRKLFVHIKVTINKADAIDQLKSRIKESSKLQKLFNLSNSTFKKKLRKHTGSRIKQNKF